MIRVKSEKNQILEDVLSALEENREKSLRESDKTDLRNEKPSDDINSWYSSIQQIIKKKPPEEQVETVIIKTNIENEVLDIEYLYGTYNNHIITFQVLPNG